MAFEELRDVLRARLLDAFEDVRLEKTPIEGATQVANVFWQAFHKRVQPWSRGLEQIAELDPEEGKVIIGNGHRWILGDPCDCVGQHVGQVNPHQQYQARGEMNLPGGYAGLDHEGKIPAALLPPAPAPAPAVAFASTSTTSDEGPSTGEVNPFAGAAVKQNAPLTGIAFDGAKGAWSAAEAGVYEVSVMLPATSDEASTATLAIGPHVIAGLGVEGPARTLSANILLELVADVEVAVTVTPESAGALLTIGAGATVNIRRVA